MLALLCGEVTVCVMRSKLKILAMAVVFGGVFFTGGCNDTEVVLPPAESAEGRVESQNLMVEREASEKLDRRRAELQRAVRGMDQYTIEGLEKDTTMDPFVRDALLMAKRQKEERRLQKEKERVALMEREREAGEFLAVIAREKALLAAAEAEYAGYSVDQRVREVAERRERNEGAPEGMVWVPGGKFLRGSVDLNARQRQQYGEEYPAHLVEVDGFYMDATEVTNAQFAEFVKATGYRTLAETGMKAEDFPEARAEDLKGGANVFKKTSGKIDPWKGSPWRWWSFTPGATWRHPEGPGSDIKEKMDHPVTCVNYDDAVAYAKWAGKRLPTEAEWERAARGGEHAKRYIWGKGDEMLVDGKWMANVYQGDFPSRHEQADGYLLTAPVKSYPANAWGLYDMAGNVWEICNDYYHPGYYHTFVKQAHKNPQGPESPITANERAAFDPVAGTCPMPRGESNALIHLRVARGGSFLCSAEYCSRFRASARHYHEVLTPSQHTGFRCVQDKKH